MFCFSMFLHIAPPSGRDVNQDQVSTGENEGVENVVISVGKTVTPAAFRAWAPRCLISCLTRTRLRTQARAHRVSNKSEEESQWSLDVTTGCKSEVGRQKADVWQGKGIGRILEGPFGAGRHWSVAIILLALLVATTYGSEDYYRGKGDTREYKVVGWSKAVLVTYRFLSCILSCSISLRHITNPLLCYYQATDGVLCSIPVQEYEALHNLYNATDGVDWVWKPVSDGALWTFTSTGSIDDALSAPCGDSWQGITCTHLSTQNCTITELVLGQYNLHGFIPSSIGQLRSLFPLILAANSLTGSIPSSIGQLTALHALELYLNSLTGSIPSSIGQLTALSDLDMDTNSLTGSIPSSIGQLRNLNFMGLFMNSLTGSIPSSIGQLTTLFDLYLDTNSLTGSMPSWIGRVTTLSGLSLAANQLTGSIPSSIGQLRNLFNLGLFMNSLTGSIPSWIGQLRNLSDLNLGTNSLTGSIPSWIGQLRNLNGLALDTNLLSGSIPSSIGQLRKLDDLELGLNSLTGSIPSSMGQLTALYILFLYANSLTGSIPSWIGQLTAHYELDLDTNSLSGSIPSFGQLTALSELALYTNSLTGSIPSSIGQLRNISYLALYTNSLTGLIPSSLRMLTNLDFLFLNSNALTGSIPSIIALLSSLELVFLQSNYLSGPIPSFSSSTSSLYLYDNFLTGTIPPSLGTMLALQYLSLYANCLTGTVPLSIRNSSSLLQMQVNDNALTGDLGFLHTNMSSLSVLDVRNNSFHGSLPADLFLLPNISVIAAVGNCLSGTLPAEICRAGSLQTLILDGLSTSTSCRVKYFPFSAAYALKKAVTGTIPACLLSLDNMSTLHLSGNRFTGTLPDPGAGIGTNLRNLSLSYNGLSGPIPEAMQMHEWVNLDLSSNRLSGTLLPSFRMASISSNASLSLGKNYLSGDIPSSLREMDVVSVLTGNIFGCSADRSSLPVNDPVAASYQCGSTLLDVALYTWLALLSVLAIVVLGLPRDSDPRNLNIVRGCERAWLLVKSLNWARLQTLVASFRGKCGHGNGNEFKLLLKRVRQLSYTLMGVCIVVLLPTYSALNAAHSNYEISYAWILSVSMASGEFAAVVVVVVWSFLFAFVAMGCYFMVQRDTDSDSKTRPKPSQARADGSNLTQILYLSALTVVNIVFIGGMNLAYQYVDVDYFSWVLGAFKGLWNSIALPAGYKYALLWSRQSNHDIANTNNGHNGRNIDQNHQQSSVGLLYQSLTAFNVFVMPALAVLLLEADCFGYLFISPPEISSTYAYNECVINPLTFMCVYESISVPITYPPPFEYNYRCSNTFVQRYAMVFVVSAIVGSVMTCVKYVVRVDPEAMFGPRLAAAIQSFVVLDPDVLMFTDVRFLTTFLSSLCTLLTFGLMYPPLGVVLCVAIVLDTLYVEVELGRYLEGAGDDGARLAERQRAVGEVTAGVKSAMWEGLWVMTFPSSMFWGFFVFDILGGKVEEAWEAIWAPVVIASLPMVTWMVGMMVVRVWTRQHDADQKLPLNSRRWVLRSTTSVFGFMPRMSVARDLQMNELFDQRSDVEGNGSLQLRPRKPLEGQSEPAESESVVLGDRGTPSTQSRDEECDVEPTTEIVAWDSNPMSTLA